MARPKGEVSPQLFSIASVKGDGKIHREGGESWRKCQGWSSSSDAAVSRNTVDPAAPQVGAGLGVSGWEPHPNLFYLAVTGYLSPKRNHATLPKSMFVLVAISMERKKSNQMCRCCINMYVVGEAPTSRNMLPAIHRSHCSRSDYAQRQKERRGEQQAPSFPNKHSFFLQSGLYLNLPWWQQCVPVSSLHPPRSHPVTLIQSLHSNYACYQNSLHLWNLHALPLHLRASCVVWWVTWPC